jgi:transcriptional regulator with XRE-family HTH domain
MFEVIADLMEKRGITAYQLSHSIGVSQGAISLWKLGIRKPSSDALQKLADYFDVSVDYLLGRTKRRKPYRS